MPELGERVCCWCLFEGLFQNDDAVMPVVKAANISLVRPKRARAECVKKDVVFWI